MKVESNSLWTDGQGRYFRVLSLTDVDGKTWVHYREDKGIKVAVIECKEFSCYVESFVERFRACPT